MVEQHLIIWLLALSLDNGLLVIGFRDGEHLAFVVEISDVTEQRGGVYTGVFVIDLQGFVVGVHGLLLIPQFTIAASKIVIQPAH